MTTIQNGRNLIENNSSSNDENVKKAFALKVFNALQKNGIISKDITINNSLPRSYNSNLIENAILEKKVNNYQDRFKVSLLGETQPKTYKELFETLINDIDKNGKLDIDLGILKDSGILNKKVSEFELSKIILNEKDINFGFISDNFVNNEYGVKRGDYISFTNKGNQVLNSLTNLDFVEKKALPGKAPYAYSVDKKLEIDATKLGVTIADTLAKEIGIENLKLRDNSRDYSNLRSYLSGSLDDLHFTGKEDDLKKWVLSQSDNSIDPVEIIVEAVKLNDNNLFKAYVCIHELLRNEARFYADYIDYDSSYENKEAFFNKFIDIRGDLEERSPEFTGDHSGSWYRIFGMQLYMLDDMVDPKGNLESEKVTDLLWGKAVSSIAENIKPVIGWYERDWRKSEINSKGASIMYSLLDRVSDYKKSNIIPPKVTDLGPSEYIKPAD